MPGMTGTPAAMAVWRALTLSEKSLRFLTVGPTNAMPFSSQSRASSDDSLRKP